MNRRVVITGMGLISPVGNDVAAAWESLKSGRCGIGQITKFDTTDYKVKIAAEVRDFDPLQYMDKLDVQHSDPYTHMAMAAVCQAVEDSGVIGAAAPERIGVYIGTGIGGIGTFMDEHKKLLEKGPRRVSPFFIPMMIANMAAGMTAIRFNCKGAAMPAVTACASGSNAIGEALRAIRHGYVDVMISGGAEATVNEIALAGFTNMKALSTSSEPLAASLPFDARRGGFVIGEGAGALILEEYEHAKARGAKIYAELCGYGSTCDAYHITSPAEDGMGAAKAMLAALSDGGVRPEDITYINAHGTGTHHNDLFETRAIRQAFGAHADKIRVNSTKSMVGHLLGAAGAVELITCVKEMEAGLIHKTAGYKTPDPELDLDYCAEAYEEEIPYALSNSLGFGGHNASLLIKKY